MRFLVLLDVSTEDGQLLRDTYGKRATLESATRTILDEHDPVSDGVSIDLLDFAIVGATRTRAVQPRRKLQDDTPPTGTARAG